MPLSGNGLTQNAPNCFVHTITVSGKQTARWVVGRIFKQTTKGRPSPPACLSEFNCGYTPFAYGHVMALELGGWDDSANIVPQYEKWQGVPGGAWRNMENAVYAAIEHCDVFLAQLTYGDGPFAKLYDDQSWEFNVHGRMLMHWEEPRIPVRFQVWTVANNWASGMVNIADYFAADDSGKDTQVAALFAALPNARSVLDATVDSMPDIDRNYWRQMMIKDFVRKEHGKYAAQVAEANRSVREHNEKVTGGGRPKRMKTANIDPSGPPLLQETVTLDLARWLQQAPVRQDLADRLGDPNNPVPQSYGWTKLELTMLTPQVVEGAVFAK